jgi:rhodanese-related sulfurtransferase
MEILKARIPHFYTSEELSVTTNRGKTHTLPVKSFVQVMSLRNLPRGFEKNWEGFNKEKDIICYCSFGYVVIPISLIESSS